MQKDESTHDEEEGIEKEDTYEGEEESSRPDTKTPSRRIQKKHPETQIIGDKMLKSVQGDNYHLMNKPYSQ